MSRFGRRSRLGLLALVAAVAAVAAVAGSAVLTAGARAEAPARWRTFLLADGSAARPAPPPAAGSTKDRSELEEVVGLQAGTDSAGALISYWTSAPTPVRWNEILLARVRLDRMNPVRTSRALALLNAAMYDAVVAACDAKIAFRRASPAERDGRIRRVAPADELSSYASVDAAIAAAAESVLAYLFPGRFAEYAAKADEVRRIRLLTGTATRSDVEAGTAIGAAVGVLAVARAMNDGSQQIWRGEIPTFDGAWKPARPFRNDQPLEPTAGSWRPWLMTAGSDFRPGPPPAFKSPEWQRDADEVIAVDAALTDDEVRIARFWADGAGTDTPPGHWMRIAMELALRDRLSTAEAARVFAWLGTAQADAFIACWDAKYTYWSGRPTGLIPGFASTIITPNFPAYISGHSSVSGASSTVLAHFFPRDRADLVARSEEAAVSRLYGGIHWRSDNEVGLEVGRRVGRLAADLAAADANAR